MKFKTNYNVSEFPKTEGYFEVNTLPSETVPDETMSIKEIYRRYASGQPLGAIGVREGVYEGLNPSLPLDWDKMDLSERYEFAAQHALKLTEAKKLLDEKKKKDEEETYKQLIIAEYEASKKPEEPKLEQPKPNP